MRQGFGKVVTGAILSGKSHTAYTEVDNELLGLSLLPEPEFEALPSWLKAE